MLLQVIMRFWGRTSTVCLKFWFSKFCLVTLCLIGELINNVSAVTLSKSLGNILALKKDYYYIILREKLHLSSLSLNLFYAEYFIILENGKIIEEGNEKSNIGTSTRARCLSANNKWFRFHIS